MIERRLLSRCCLMLLLVPTFAWAIDESETAPIAPAETATETSANTAPTSTPAKPVPTPASSVQTAPLQAAPGVSAPVKSEPAKPAPAKALPAKPPLAKPASSAVSPAKPLAAKPAPSTIAPAKPATLSPAAVQLRPAASAINSPIQLIPDPGTTESPADNINQTIDIEFFIRDDCQQCDKAKEFLTKLGKLQPQLNIATRDVRKEPAALELLKRMSQNQGAALDYPAFVVGGQLIIGFSEEAGTAQLILDTLATNHPADQQVSADSKNCTTGKEPSCSLIAPEPAPKPEKIHLTIFGYKLHPMQIGLPIFTLAMGMLDGFNYGSTWVLILIISLLAPMKNRSLLLAITGTFITVQGVIYFIIMAAWFNLSMMIEVSRITQFIFASIALLATAIYFKNYMQFGRNISLSSSEIIKPGIYTRIRKIAQAQNLMAALLGTIALATLVQLGELTFKSAFPLLYTRVLTLQHLDTPSNYGYLLLYDFSYMLDDIIVLIIGIATLNQQRTQEKPGRMLKLISGLVMICVSIYLLRFLY